MKSNKVIYIGVFASLLMFSVLYLSTADKPGEGKVQQHSPIVKPMTIKSVTGDSTADSYDSLQATVYSGIKKYEEVENSQSELEEEIKRLKKDFEKYKNEVAFAIDEKEKNLKQEIATNSKVFADKNEGNDDALMNKKNDKLTKDELKNKVSLYTPKSTNTPPEGGFAFKDSYSLSDGLGFSTLKKNPVNKASRAYSKDDPNGGWVMPIESNGLSNPAIQAKNDLKKSDKPTVYSAMTISDNSILYDTTALTYLVGRIPVDGRVEDPFPAKMIVGKEVLIANGHDLPGIEGMFFSGYATGDMNLGCVRAEMNSYTFVFDDGRQVSFRETPKSGEGKEEPMAYISDRFGLPCVMGNFVSNVAEFLSIQSGLSALTAAGEAFAAAQTTTSLNAVGGSQSTVTGDAGKYSMGKVVSGAFGDISKWMLARQENSFDAVVVPSGTKVSLHLNRNILIDYDEAARRVDYRYRMNKSNLD